MDIAFFYQKAIHVNFKKRTPFDWKVFLLKRVHKFFEEGSHNRIEDLPHIYGKNKGRLGPKFISTHLRTICNQWCSSRRFGMAPGSCPFGCAEGDDSIAHCLLCPHFEAISRRVIVIPRRLSLAALLLFEHDGCELDDLECSQCLFYVYICFCAFNSCKHGRKCNLRLIQFIAKHTFIRSNLKRSFTPRRF